MKLFLIMPVEDMKEMLAGSSQAWQFRKPVLFASSLMLAWELATCVKGRMLAVTPSTIQEIQPVKKKPRVLDDMLGNYGAPSRVFLLTCLVHQMAALEIERDVSVLLSNWEPHELQRGEHLLTGYSPDSIVGFQLEATDVICALRPCWPDSWKALVAASNEAAKESGSGVLEPPALEAAVAISATAEAAVHELAAKNPSIFYIATTEKFLAHITEQGCKPSLHPRQFASLHPLSGKPSAFSPSKPFLPLFQDMETAVAAVHAHAVSCQAPTWPQHNWPSCFQWNWPRASLGDNYALLKIEVQQLQMEEFLRNRHLQLSPKSRCVELMTELDLTAAGVCAEWRVEAAMSVEIGERRSMREVWVEQLQDELKSVQKQKDAIMQIIERSDATNWRPPKRMFDVDVPCDNLVAPESAKLE